MQFGAVSLLAKRRRLTGNQEVSIVEVESLPDTQFPISGGGGSWLWLGPGIVLREAAQSCTWHAD
eukprot:6033116-Amphidinium_carterae.1